MIDNLSLAISHGLMLLAAWRLLSRADLDSDDARPDPGFGKAAHGARRAAEHGPDHDDA